MEMINSRGPDHCIDAVGCETHTSSGLVQAMDTVQQSIMQGDRSYVLQAAIRSCRKGGTLSIAGGDANNAE